MRAVIFSLCLWPTLAGASELFSPQPSERLPLQILRSENPIFPYELRTIGIKDGDARVVVSIDENGRLVDTLVTAYSRREFADAAVRSLQKWEFAPAQVAGTPVASLREIFFRFNHEGVVVVMQSASEHMSARIEAMSGEDHRYRVHWLHELDRMPEPTEVVSPAYPAAFAGRGVSGRVTVEFYIDEEGRVRLPAIVKSTHDEFAPVVIAALERWRFEPPLHGGQPVLVRVQQSFNFEPQEKSNSD